MRKKERGALLMLPPSEVMEGNQGPGLGWVSMGQEGKKWFPTRQKNFPEGRAVTTYLGLGLPPSCRHPLLPLAGSQLEEGRALRRWAWGRREALRLPGPLGGPTASGPTPWSHTLGKSRASSETFLPLLSIREELQPTPSIPKITGGARSGDTERGRRLLFQLTRSCGVPATCQELSQGLAGEQSG